MKMSSFKFVQKEIASKGFNKEIQVTGILTIDVNKVILSHEVSCNNVRLSSTWRNRHVIVNQDTK